MILLPIVLWCYYSDTYLQKFCPQILQCTVCRLIEQSPEGVGRMSSKWLSDNARGTIHGGVNKIWRGLHFIEMVLR